MNNETRVLTKEELKNSGIRLTGYKFPDKELDCIVTVDEKVYNKHMGISTYVTTEDGEKFILSVWKDKDAARGRNYMPSKSDVDISKVALGAKLKVKIVKSSKSDLYFWLEAEEV